jgi:hypothetical protein
MRTRAMWARTERVAFIVWLAASAGACTSWQTVDVSPEQLLTEKHPDEIRVTRQDGSQVDLVAPQAIGDTMVGVLHPSSAVIGTMQTAGVFGAASDGQTVTNAPSARIPFNDAVRIETSQVDAGRTALLVIGMAALGALIVGAAAMSSSLNGMAISFGC